MTKHTLSTRQRGSPFLFYAIVFLGIALAGALALRLILGWDILLAWLVAVTVVTLLAYRYDKLTAGSERTRVPERVLLLLALAGGSLGAIAGMWFIGEHHKTSKRSFMLSFLLILVVQAVLLGIYLWVRLRG